MRVDNINPSMATGVGPTSQSSILNLNNGNATPMHSSSASSANANADGYESDDSTFATP
jgi:hypothetical protein